MLFSHFSRREVFLSVRLNGKERSNSLSCSHSLGEIVGCRTRGTTVRSRCFETETKLRPLEILCWNFPQPRVKQLSLFGPAHGHRIFRQLF